MPQTPPKISMRTNTLALILFWASAFAALSPWLYVQSQAMLNGNVTWLLIAAERMLDGQTMSLSIYETNPPLSILLYAPHILFMKIASLPPEVGPLILTATMIFLSILASAVILRRYEYLNTLERHTILVAQTATLTYLSAIYFMDREHLMLIAMIPFLLAQIGLTDKIFIPRRILWPVLIAGTFTILVKPQYGILPAALLLHRLIVHKTWKIALHPDFITLATGTLLYAAAILIFFSDYLNIILPDVLEYYIGSSDKFQTLRLFKIHFIMYIALFLFDLLTTDLDKSKKRLLLILELCALLALIPLLVQMKGYYNHLLPAFGLFIISLALSVLFRLERWVFKQKSAAILYMIAPIAVLCLTGLKIKPAWNYPKGHEIRSLPVARYLSENCSSPCTFFAFHGDIETINPTAFYTGHTHGTRFPSYWYLPGMLSQIKHEASSPNSKENEKLQEDRVRYGRFAAEDLKNFSPDLLLIGTNIDIMGQGEFFDYVDFFSINDDFKKTLSENYIKTGTFNFDRAEYFRGTSLSQTFILTYDVYKRKDQGGGVPSSP